MNDPNKDPLIPETQAKWILDFKGKSLGSPPNIDLLIPYPRTSLEEKEGLWLSTHSIETARQKQADFLQRIEALQENLLSLQEGMQRSREETQELNRSIEELYDAVEKFNAIIRKFSKE